MNKTTKVQSKKTTAADSKPAQLAKIIYAGLVRLKATKEAQKCGRNCLKRLDFGQAERVNAIVKIDHKEIK
jgi:hypothetical protein